MNIYIGGPIIVDDYTAMQGPAPDGFHIPLSTEWQGLDTIMTSLSLTTGDSWRINLHMPFAGSRGYYSADLGGQGSNGDYWSSSPYGSGSPSYASNLFLDLSNVSADDSYGRASGLSVRCFKDSFELPTSSWTVVQGTLGSAGIFWNQTEGIISITSDGTTGYTIADKNLGATTVYNDGDTLSQANMGNMYQWGNNYGFPSTGSVSKTSSTQVNASTYGPGTTNGYYESDTCITRSSDRSSVRNDNLRGGVTGVVQKTVSQELKNAYIGEVRPNFATQGPCPDGFHVPLSSERTGLKTIMDGMSMTPDNWRINLHLPFAGYRYYYNSDINNQGTGGYYWSSYSPNDDGADYLYIWASYVGNDHNRPKSEGYSIRAFKDSFEAPTSSWIVVSGTLGSAGIFRNQTDGLISITSDGSTGYTIQDKNLGATTVYSNGNTLSEANCGKYYQWGNNYGFAWTGSITTSTTQVDASNYGPGNYYSSSTFIYRKESPYSWDSSNNQNLRGGVDGNVPVS